MRNLAILALLALGGCGEEPKHTDPWSADIYIQSLNTRVTAYHDEERNVTCWISDGHRSGGISCLPDSALKGQGHAAE